LHVLSAALSDQHVSRVIQLLGEKIRPTNVRMHALHQAVISRADFLFGRPCIQSEDFEGLSNTHLAGRRMALPILLPLPPFTLARGSFLFLLPLAILLLLPFLAFSRGSFALSLLFLLLLLSAESCKRGLRPGIALISGEFVKARGLAFVLRQAATAMLVEEPEIDLRRCVSLVGGELAEARGLAIILWQPTAALRVEEPEIAPPASVSLVGSELKEAHCLVIVLRQAATALRVEEPETVLPAAFPWSAASL
jgi:hypothetical protein